MTRILITGATGYLGIATMEALVKEGYIVIALGQPTDSLQNSFPGVRFLSIDICDKDALVRVLREECIDAVYHFAAKKDVGACEKSPGSCFRVNAGGTASLLSAMEDTGVHSLIYASTWAVYDPKGDILDLSEDSSCVPSSVYGTSKLMSEQMIMKTHGAGGIRQYHILRYGNIVGRLPAHGEMKTPSFLDRLIAAVRTDAVVELRGSTFTTTDGTAALDYIDIRDVATANVRALRHAGSGVYNIGSGTSHTLLELVRMVEEYTQKKVRVVTVPSVSSGPSLVRIDSEKAQNEFEWAPQYSIKETISSLF